MVSSKIVVMGAGAVGCCYGSMLALAGNDVTLIGRPSLVNAVAENGFTFERDGCRELVPIAVSSSPEAVRNAEIVIFSVKSGETEPAGLSIAAYLSPDTTVISLQNGIGNAERLAAILDRTVIAAVVYIAAEMTAPGHVCHKANGKLIFPEGLNSEAAARVFRGAGICVEVSRTAHAEMWAKFVINCCFNALSALTHQNYGTILKQSGVQQLLKDTMTECLAVAAASGVSLPNDIWDNMMGVIAGMADQYSSTCQDVMRGRKTEIDYLNGEIVRRAVRLGIATPVNNALWVMVRIAERAYMTNQHHFEVMRLPEALGLQGQDMQR